MKVVVGLSGGVDSSLAAALLKEQGFDVLGVTMKLTDTHGAGKDVEDSKAVAEKLQIPYEVWDLSELYDQEVVKPFANSYAKGETPNPCVNCNKQVKLNAFIKLVREKGYDKLATGHYVQVENNLIKRAVNRKKDQSYFVASMPPELVEFVMFPLGKFASKDEVRAEAEKRELITASKKDSADICFLQEGVKKGSFLKDMIEAKKRPDFGIGNILDMDGNILGQHSGFYNFTIGQRGGLDLKNPAKDGLPRYVVKINPDTAEVIVGSKEELNSKTVRAKDVILFVDEKELISRQTRAQIRSNGVSLAGFTRLIKSDNGNELEFTVLDGLEFNSVAKGQSLVIYDSSDTFVLAKASLT